MHISIDFNLNDFFSYFSETSSVYSKSEKTVQTLFGVELKIVQNNLKTSQSFRRVIIEKYLQTPRK